MLLPILANFHPGRKREWLLATRVTDPSI